VEYGGCSAKLNASKLAEALKHLPVIKSDRLLVSIETHDDAGVYKLTDDLALVQTVDFFPPLVSDPYEFGRIAAANALSDVYAMGGIPITAMNLVMYPSSKMALSGLGEILKGGQDKVTEAGALIVGGHTIDDDPPKYGLSVTGLVHPDKIVTNAAAKPSDVLVLTKPIGTGILVAGLRLKLASDADYRTAIENMKLLNKGGGEAMTRHGVKAGTDVTGFSLLGHALKMALGSSVTIKIDSAAVPLLPGALNLADKGCLPGACFRNQEFTEPNARFRKGIPYPLLMLLHDAQTSGGLLACVSEGKADAFVTDCRKAGYGSTAVIGEVLPRAEKALILV
jgi:selenide,water dikinase